MLGIPDNLPLCPTRSLSQVCQTLQLDENHRCSLRSKQRMVISHWWTKQIAANIMSFISVGRLLGGIRTVTFVENATVYWEHHTLQRMLANERDDEELISNYKEGRQ